MLRTRFLKSIFPFFKTRGESTNKVKIRPLDEEMMRQKLDYIIQLNEDMWIILCIGVIPVHEIMLDKTVYYRHV